MNSNLQPQIDALKTTIRELGRESGLGRDAREKLAIALSRAAYQGIIGTDDVPDMVEEYINAESKKLIHNHSANGRKVMESKCRQIVAVSAVEKYDFPNTLEQACEIRKTLRQNEDTKIKPGFESYVELARLVKDKKEPLSESEITNAMLKPEPADKSELDRMVDEYKRLYSLANGTKDRPGIPSVEPVLEAMRAAIEDNGGEIPPMTKDEKKAAEAIAFLAKTGRLAGQAPAEQVAA